MMCHVLSWPPCLHRSVAVLFLHIVPPSPFVPSPPPAAGRASLFCAQSRAPLRGGGRASCAGAVRAPDCPRARVCDGRRAHPSRLLAPGVCGAPAIASLRRKAERRPRKPPLSAPILPQFLSGQAPPGTKMKPAGNFLTSHASIPLNRRDNISGRGDGGDMQRKVNTADARSRSPAGGRSLPQTIATGSAQ